MSPNTSLDLAPFSEAGPPAHGRATTTGSVVHSSETSAIKTNQLVLTSAEYREKAERTLDRSWQDLARFSDARAREKIPHELADRLQVLPVSLSDGHFGNQTLVIIVSERCVAQSLKELQFSLPDSLQIIADTAPEATVRRAIHAAYLGDIGHLTEAKEKAETVLFENSPRLRANSPVPFDTGHPVPELLKAILDRAVALSASDIHFEPFEDSYRLRFRVDGLLRSERSDVFSSAVAESIIRRIKISAELDHTISQRPQEGGFDYKEGAVSVRLRVSSVPQVRGEKIVLRLLNNNLLEVRLTKEKRGQLFSGLGLSIEQEHSILAALAQKSGVILITGPTGSGKSTLLYTALFHLLKDSRNIATIEDPVERLIPGLNQSEVKRDFGLDYRELFPSLLRQDPDVIMLGEIRDEVTANAVFTAGLTGHLVLSTLHTANCLEALSRLKQLGVEPTLVASSLKLIVSQRLVPKNCPACALIDIASCEAKHFFSLEEDIELYASRGCERCSGTGITGRIGVFELLRLTRAVRQHLVDARTADDLAAFAREAGYRPFAEKVRDLLKEGVISAETALETLGIAPQFFGY